MKPLMRHFKHATRIAVYSGVPAVSAIIPVWIIARSRTAFWFKIDNLTGRKGVSRRTDQPDLRSAVAVSTVSPVPRA